MAKRILGVLFSASFLLVAITACESNSSSPGGSSGAGTSGMGTSGSTGGLPDGGGVVADGGEGGLPPTDAGMDADAGPLDPTQCTWTATGAQVASGTCMFAVAFAQADNALDFSMTGAPFSVSFGGGVTGQTTLTTGTYTLAQIPEAGGTFDMGTSLWAMCNNGGCSDGAGNNIPNQGTFTLNITSTGPVTNGILWQKPHGSLDMTLPFDPNTTSSGNVLLHATF